MIKAHISNRLYDLLYGKISKNQAIDLVDTVFDIIKKTLASGEDVKFSSFGTFQVRDKSEHVGRNPQTGEPMTISARRVVRFKASDVLRRALNLK